jgi:hypothetical protein
VGTPGGAALPLLADGTITSDRPGRTSRSSSTGRCS